FDVTETFDGGYVFSMEPEYVVDSTSNGDFALLKLDSAGNFVWSNPAYGWRGWDFGYSIKQTNDSGFVIAGVRGLFAGIKTQAVLYKSDKNGNVQWFKSYGNLYNNRDAQFVDITSDGGFVLAGYVRDSSFGYIGSKFYLIKTNSVGNSNYCNESNEIPEGGAPNITFTPGGTEGSGGAETTPATVTTVIT